MKGLRSIVPLPRESLRGITPAPIVGKPPTIEWVNPRDLFIEESYQRDVGENGTALIRRIVQEFSWHKFKTPICFRAPEFDGAIVVVDGQHTSIGCATREEIEIIPVAVYESATEAERAAAFVAHNRDKVALTMQAIFKADIAPGDQFAVAANRACEAAGAKILTQAINLSLPRPVGETMAVGTIRSIVKKFGEEHLTRTMRVLVAAGRGPIKAQEIGAVSNILVNWRDDADVDALLADLIRSKTAKAWASLGAQEAGTLPQALTTLWLRALSSRLPAATKKDPGPVPTGEVRKAIIDKPKAEPVKPPPPSVNRFSPTVKEPVPAVPVSNYRQPDPPKPVYLTQANGIFVTIDGRITRGDNRAVVSADAAKLVARLVSVMPAQIGFERLSQYVFSGRPNARMLLDDLVEILRRPLAGVGLEIFRVERSGYMIRETAKSGDNLLRAYWTYIAKSRYSIR